MVRLAEYADQVLYSFSDWHIIVLGAVFAAAVSLLMLGAFFSKHPVVSLLFQLFSLAMLTAGAIAGYYLADYLFRRVETHNMSIWQLYYTDLAIVRGEAVNVSKERLIGCIIGVKAYPPTSGGIDYLLKLANPSFYGEKKLESALEAESSLPFEVELNGVKYDDNLTFSIRTKCR
ncbi:MAG: DUF2393 domain-containing protein [Helicobacteraceae bacterium]|nr:DUF2393 domain-containing protein [Helicobacteraceae bacterium]